MTEEDIAKVVASWTGIPVSRLQEGERAKLSFMEDRLGKRVIGQAHHNPFGDGYAAARICATIMGAPDAVAGLTSFTPILQAV